MLRYVVPALLFVAAWYVWHYNATHDGSFMLFPPLGWIPALRDDIPAQAEWSWRLIAAVAAVVLALNVGSHVRQARRKPGQDDEG